MILSGNVGSMRFVSANGKQIVILNNGINVLHQVIFSMQNSACQKDTCMVGFTFNHIPAALAVGL